MTSIMHPGLYERSKLLKEIEDPSVRAAFDRASKDLQITSKEVADIFSAASRDNPMVPGDSTTPREKRDLQRISKGAHSLLSTMAARETFDSKLADLEKRPQLGITDDDGGLRSSQVAVDKIMIKGQASGFVWCPPNARCIGAPSTYSVELDGKAFSIHPKNGESAASVAQRLADAINAGGGQAKVQQRMGTAFLTVSRVFGPDSVKLGSYAALSGKIENRSLVGIGGEAPPSGSYLVLDKPISVDGQPVKELFVQRWPELTDGAQVKLNGRLDKGTWGGVETPESSYFALSGVSNLTAGEPKFDGKFFTDSAGKQLSVLSYNRPLIMDAPAQIFVLDQGNDRAHLGSMGGFIPPYMNPFHGFSGSVAIENPTQADRDGVIQGPLGEPISAATGKKLVLVGEEGNNVVPFPDMMSHRWYMDEDKKEIYRLDSGGIAGFISHMSQVIRLPTQDF
jgi:hypothetical protein